MNPDPISTTLRSASEPADTTLSSATAGPGRVIRQARERAKLGIEELAAMTRLAKTTLEALERDDFTTLTEAVYVRGYYRKCAKVLALPEAELIAAYEKLYAPKAAPMPTKLLLGNSGSTMGSSASSSGSGWVIVVVIAVLIGVGAWFLTHDETEAVAAAVEAVPPAAAAIPASELTTPTVTDPAATTPPPAEAAASDAALLAAASGQPTATPSAAPAGVALTPATTLSSPPAADATASGAPVSSEGGALVLDFKSASWVRIEDADGRTLLSGTIQSGDRQVLKGRTRTAAAGGRAHRAVQARGR